MEVNFDVLLYWAGAIITISAACGVIIGIISKKFKKMTGEIVCNTMKSFGHEMDEKLKTLSTELDAKIEHLNTQLVDLSESTTNGNLQTQEALKCLIRATINDAYKKYYEDLHNIDLHTLESLENLFEIYTAFGGNHFIENQMQRLRTLIQT